MIVVINGSAKNGKDHFANFFIKHYDGKSINLSTIDKVKKIAKENFAWDGKKTNEARKFLAELKRIWGEYNNGPFLHMINKIDKHYNILPLEERNGMIYFVHCREPYEIQKFKDKYGDSCYTVLLKRDDREVPDNEADKNVANYNYDKYVDNNGNKNDLELDAIKFVEEIREILKKKKQLSTKLTDDFIC